MRHDSFVTTGRRPFRHDLYPMRLFQKAKRFGIWNPADIDFGPDRAAYPETTEEDRDATLGTLSVFIAGEECVTNDILPLIGVMAREGRIEDEIFLTSFLWEEAKHVEFFERWLREVAQVDTSTLAQYHTPSYRKLFYEILPETMWRLQQEPTPENQVKASVTYNMIIEGVLAETGYYGFYHQAELTGTIRFPGLIEGIGKLKQDESRHIAYGVYLISRLMAEHPNLWSVAEAEMNRLMLIAMAFVQERLQTQIDKHGSLPNGTDASDITNYAAGQYRKRFERLQKARKQSLDEIERIALETEDAAA